MKRIALLCIALVVLALALVGCGGNNPKAEAAKAVPAAGKNKPIKYPAVIGTEAFIGDGITPVAGTPLGLVGEMDKGERRMNRLKAYVYQGKKRLKGDLVDVTSKTEMDTKVLEVGGRYLVHADSLHETLPGRFLATTVDAGPSGLKKVQSWTEKVPFGREYVHGPTGLKFTSELYGEWRWWDLYVEVNDRYDLTEYNSSLAGESRFRIIKERYVVHMSAISKKSRSYYIVQIWDFGENAFPDPRAY